MDLNYLHPESLTLDMIPNPDDADSWYVVHGSGEQCEEDRRAGSVAKNLTSLAKGLGEPWVKEG
jgi:hypothetical protein